MEPKHKLYLSALIAAAAALIGGWAGKAAALAAIISLLQMALTAFRNSETDSLTKLHNRRCFDRLTRTHYSEISALAVLFFDLNGLKQTNDAQGHAGGDARLRIMAQALSDAAGTKHRAFRIGGDEFLLIIENPSEKTLCCLSAQVSAAADAAAGWAVGPGSSMDELIAEACKKMYGKKRNK